MKQTIVVTGALGFLGTHVLDALISRKLHQKYSILAIIRPGTTELRKKPYTDHVTFKEHDFRRSELTDHLKSHSIATIIHLAAIVTLSGYTKEEVFSVNLKSTQRLADYCLHKRIRLLFCSSVGVFGAIPKDVPATETTPKVKDTWYHESKILSEEYLTRLFDRGLDCLILRPAIIYGKGDHGFLYKITKLCQKGVFPTSTYQNTIHLTSAELFAEVIARLMQKWRTTYRIMNVCDAQPIKLHEMLYMIQERLNKENHGCAIWRIPQPLVGFAKKSASLLGRTDIEHKIRRLSEDWYFDVTALHKTFPSSQQYMTVQTVQPLLDWYVHN